MTELQHDEGALQSGAPSIGDRLRAAREARGESLSDVAFALKLTMRQVEAMETGRFDLLPGPAFVRGFLRNYARYLGLDPVQVVAALEQESASGPSVVLAPVSNATGVMPNGSSQSRSSLMPAMVVAGLLLFAVLAGWYFDWFQMPGAEDGQGEAVMQQGPEVAFPQPELLPDEPRKAQEEDSDGPAGAPEEGGSPSAAGEPAVALSPVVPESRARPSAEPTVPMPVTPPLTVSPAPATPPTPPTAEARPPEAPAVPPDGSATPDAAPTAPAPAPQAPAAEPAADMGKLVFQMRGESWLEVRDGSGAVRYSGVNAAGSTRVVQGKPPFSVIVGNAPEVEVEYNGRRVEMAPHTRVGVARLKLQ